MRVIVRTLIGLVCVLGISACRSVYPGAGVASLTLDAQTGSSTSTQSPDQGQSSIWPLRWGVEHIEQGTNAGVIVEIEHSLSELSRSHLSIFHQFRVGETEYRDMQSLASGVGITEPYKFQAEGPGSFLFVHTPPIDDASARDLKDGEPELLFKFITAQHATSDTADLGSDDRVELERTWFTYRAPKEGVECIGTISLMPGMFGTPEPVIDGMERYFRSKGWAVLRMLSHPSRFTNRRVFDVPIGSESEVAPQIAEMFDTRTAEAAYSASAALRFVHERFPDGAEKPVLLLGMSGGAMILPTVYSFDPSLYDAAVMIAGGGNFLKINAQSNYANWIDAIDLDTDPDEPRIQKPEDDQIEVLSDLYLAESKLDSLHTAKSMQGVPMLMLHGSADKAVPASSGDALYEALGHPERWVYPVGHELIFAGLPLQTPKIERWTRKQLIED